ncbi:MAG: hypothetical protein QF588_00220 [Candidatus Poseidoniaceae archaeon]|nr:hypothetical protein [Candidatus Poseidoniaceae archaeon]
MEQRAPRVASAGKIFGTLVILACIINLNIDALGSDGLSVEEYVGLSISLVCYITAYFASRERQIIGLNSNLSLEAQLELLESTPTKSSEHKSAPIPQSNHTQSIIDSIIGEQNLVDESTIDRAIDTLSSGVFGETAQSIAEDLPAPHRNATVVTPAPSPKSAEPNVPLPEIVSNVDTNPLDSDSKELEDGPMERETETASDLTLPDLSDLFANDSVADIDKENDDANAGVSETPELPDLDDLF